MFLYSTVLRINNRPVPYCVTREDGNKFLLFKPELPLTSALNIPIFWVTRENGEWMPVNVKDKALIQQVVNDIIEHNIE